MTISVKVSGDIDKALRVLKRKVQRDGLQRELKQRRYYEKPSVKRKRKQTESKRRQHKLNRLHRGQS